jgi:hypothetical protein
MRYKTSPATGRLLEDLNRLGVDIEPRLELASPDARGEWRELRSRLPSAKDLEAGFTTVSDEELAVMCAKAARFCDILGVHRQIVRIGSSRHTQDSASGP